MLTKIEDLRKGDEVLIPHGGGFQYLKLLRDPALSYTKDQNGNKIVRLDWAGRQRWKAIMCSTRLDVLNKSRTYTNYNGTQVHTWVEKLYTPTPEEHNCNAYFNFNRKQIWLVKREKL